MLSLKEFIRWSIQNNISEEAFKYIDVNIRNAQSSRKAKGSYDLFVRYPSKKMGGIIEWKRAEDKGYSIYKLENDDDILEYYSQPPNLLFNFTKTNGKKYGFLYTPDFFIIKKREAGWEVWEPENELLDLTKSKPWLYIKDLDGNWRCPPGEWAASKLGLTFKVRTF